MNGGEGQTETLNGVVEEVLPNSLYRVRLATGRLISAGPSSTLRHIVARLIVGNRVVVQLSRHDPNRGNIIQKL